VKDEKYLKWIRQQKCCICYTPHSEPHHVGSYGSSKRNYDHEVVPVCRLHHRQAHDNPIWSKEILRPMAKEYYKKYKDLLEAWDE
jgi:hypothetical protein